jgi:hypothetical protein
MTQPSLFHEPQVGPNVFCLYDPKCIGVRVSYGPKRDLGRCVNQLVTCLKCKRDICELSTRKDLVKA